MRSDGRLKYETASKTAQKEIELFLNLDRHDCFFWGSMPLAWQHPHERLHPI